MIIELLLKPLFWFVGFILDILPDMTFGLDTSKLSGFIDFMAFAFYVFPLDLFVIIIGNVLFWLNAQVVWAAIEFIIKKIPFINLK